MNTQPDFFQNLSPATRLIVKRRLTGGDLEGADFLMKSEAPETRRKYELWKMRQGMTQPTIEATRSGPGRASIEELVAEIDEQSKKITSLLHSSQNNLYKISSSKEGNIYESKIHMEIPLTVLIPDGSSSSPQVSTASAILGLRSEYY